MYEDSIFKNFENTKNLDTLSGASWTTSAPMSALSLMGWVPPENTQP